MPEKVSGWRQIITKFLEELGSDIVEERVIQYVLRELHRGRSLVSILSDPYVTNRLNEQRVAHMLENPEIIEAVEEELSRAFKAQDFSFKE